MSASRTMSMMSSGAIVRVSMSRRGEMRTTARRRQAPAGRVRRGDGVHGDVGVRLEHRDEDPAMQAVHRDAVGGPGALGVEAHLVAVVERARGHVHRPGRGVVVSAAQRDLAHQPEEDAAPLLVHLDLGEGRHPPPVRHHRDDRIHGGDMVAHEDRRSRGHVLGPGDVDRPAQRAAGAGRRWSPSRCVPGRGGRSGRPGTGHGPGRVRPRRGSTSCAHPDGCGPRARQWLHGDVRSPSPSRRRGPAGSTRTSSSC